MKLDVSSDERMRLSEAGFKLSHLGGAQPEDLYRQTGVPLERCHELVALSQFQTLGSVGPRAAEDLWLLGFRNLESLRDGDPVAMYEQFMSIVGQRVDPCVEDVFRCAVAQVIFPDLPPTFHRWWKWKNQRGERSVCLPPELEAEHLTEVNP